MTSFITTSKYSDRYPSFTNDKIILIMEVRPLYPMTGENNEDKLNTLKGESSAAINLNNYRLGNLSKMWILRRLVMSTFTRNSEGA